MRARICRFHTVSFAFHDICEFFIFFFEVRLLKSKVMSF